MDNWLNIIPILILLAASLVLLTDQNWRHVIIAMAVLYLGIFILLLQVWPITMSSAKLITGWMSVTILTFVSPEKDISERSELSSNRLFRAIALVFIWVVAFLVASNKVQFLDVSPEIMFAVVGLLGCGLLQLGMTTGPFFTIIGILTIFSGFELLYASVETSILINGLLATVNLLIALVGSYLITIDQTGESE